jgi:hypothetical protein
MKRAVGEEDLQELARRRDLDEHQSLDALRNRDERQTPVAHRDPQEHRCPCPPLLRLSWDALAADRCRIVAPEHHQGYTFAAQCPVGRLTAYDQRSACHAAVQRRFRSRLPARLVQR